MAESSRIDGLGLEELKSLLVQVLKDNARLGAQNVELRDEIARLKDLKGRPTIKPGKPSGMQASTQPGAKTGRKKGRRGSKRAKLKIDATTIIEAQDVPADARFKGYEEFVAQDLIDGTVIVSDGAGQFDVGEHALCWVHAERLAHKLVVAKRASGMTSATRRSVGSPPSISRGGAGASRWKRAFGCVRDVALSGWCKSSP